MRECDRCGFLNPGKAEYCIKCRYFMGEGEPPRPGDDKRKPDLAPPSPDLDDAFSGRSSLDTGGYGIGGTAPGDVYGTPPSDAYAVMTGKYDKPSTKKKKKKRRASRRKPPPSNLKPKPPTSMARPATPGGRVTKGLPPPLASGAVPSAAGGRPRGKPRTVSAKRPRPSVPRPDMAVFAARVGELTTPRNVMTVIAGFLVLLALIFAVTGGGYFSSQESELLDRSAAAMRSLTSVHLGADILLDSEKKGAMSINLQVDATENGDLRATRTIVSPGGSGVTEYVRSGNVAYVSRYGGAWEPAESPDELDLSFNSIYWSISGVRQINKELVGGVECDHLAFSGGSPFLTGLIPGSEATPTTRVNIEVWIDPNDNYVKHVRIDATDLEIDGLGQCDCHLEADFSNFNVPLEITPPVQQP